MMPSRNASSPMVETCCAVCCHLPRGSVNRRSTYSTECSLSISSTLPISPVEPVAAFFAILCPLSSVWSGAPPRPAVVRSVRVSGPAPPSAAP